MLASNSGADEPYKERVSRMMQDLLAQLEALQASYAWQNDDEATLMLCMDQGHELTPSIAVSTVPDVLANPHAQIIHCPRRPLPLVLVLTSTSAEMLRDAERPEYFECQAGRYKNPTRRCGPVSVRGNARRDASRHPLGHSITLCIQMYSIESDLRSKQRLEWRMILGERDHDFKRGCFAPNRRPRRNTSLKALHPSLSTTCFTLNLCLRFLHTPGHSTSPKQQRFLETPLQLVLALAYPLWLYSVRPLTIFQTLQQAW